MRLFFGYLTAQLKRTVKAYAAVLAVTLALLVAVGAVAGVIMLSDEDDASRQKTRVGIVGDSEDKLLSIGFALLESTDTSRYTIEFVHLNSEQDCISSLAAGNVDAYVVIPDGFADAMMMAEDSTLRYVMAKSGASMGPTLMREVVGVVENYVVGTQAGSIGAYNYMRDHGYTVEQSNQLNMNMSLEYIDLITGRTEVADITELGPGNSLSSIGYYVCGLTVFFLLIWGIACCSIRVRTNRTLERIIRSRGLGCTAQVVSEYIPYMLAGLFTLMLVFGAAGAAAYFVELPIPELEYLLWYDYLLLAMRMLPAVAAITAVQFLLYELVSGMINSVLVQFVFAVLVGYVGGCFYPIYFFPQAVQTFSAYMPTGAAFGYFSGLLTYNSQPVHMVLCLAYAFGGVALSASVRRVMLARAEG